LVTQLRRIWYGPPEWIARSTSAKQRRAINFWVLVLWLIPGTVIWFAFRNALWFVGFMSVWAIWVGHLSAVAAETPVEHEKQEAAAAED
jgi:hypothetical protein